MGRPLKIAKAQAILTITDTDASTEEITVSQDLLDPASTAYGVIKGMPFIPASSTGGLTANTTYWILNITGNSTFTASETDLSANPNSTPVNLSATTGTTVSASVGVVDAYFNNPNGGVGFPTTNSNTYSVVGGDTAIIGPQVLTRVCIGQLGDGEIYTDTTLANVYGVGTDFANTLSAGTALQIAVANTNGTTDYTNLGFVSSVTGYITEAVTSTVGAGDFVVTSGDATNFIVDAPISFSGNIGGLVANATYWMLSGANTTHFQVSETQGGTAVNVSNDTQSVNATQDEAILATTATVTDLNGAAYVFADDEAGYIVRQKGKQKYLVKGGTTGLVAQCFTANLANTALTPNTMRILATYANATTQTVQSLSDHNGELFTATSGPVATGNIVLANATPVYVTFNSAVAANTANGLIYPLVQIASA